jgi:hypothetical protein
MKERSGFNKIAGPVRQASKYLSSTPYDVAERRAEPLKNKTNVSLCIILIKEPRLDDREFKAEKVTRETPKPGAVAASSAELRKTAPGEMSSLNFPNPTGQCL